MNKIAISLIALSLMASGALASQRNNDEPAARVFLGDNDFGTSNGSGLSTDLGVSSPLALTGQEFGGSAFDALAKRAMERQNGDDN